jgi:hypothetical protein
MTEERELMPCTARGSMADGMRRRTRWTACAGRLPCLTPPNAGRIAIPQHRDPISHVEGSQGWLHLSIGRADRWQNWGIVSLLVQVVAVVAGLPFGTLRVAIASVGGSTLIALPSAAGRPIGIDAGLVIRAVGPQLTGAISTAGAGWWLQTTFLADYPGFIRIFLSGGFCLCIYLAIVVGLFRLAEPLRVAGKIVHDALERR